MLTHMANILEYALDFSNILNASIAASWLVLVVVGLRFLLKKAPKWSHVALWGLVALRLLLPFSIESGFSLIPSVETIPQEILKVQGTQLQEPAQLDIVSNPAFSAAVSAELDQTVDQLQTKMVAFTWIWLFGIAAMLVYTVASFVLLRHRVGTAVRVWDHIYQSEHIASPFVLGVLRPKIYLPLHLGEKNIPHVIAHEEAHIRRRDHWWKPLGFMLLALHWFNPLMWLAYLLLCRDIELACDEKVVRELEREERADYSQALLTCSTSRWIIAACPLAFGEVGVKERVRSVLDYKKPAFWVVIVSCVVCAVVAVCFLTDPTSGIRNPWVREYTPGTPGTLGTVDTQSFESISADFAIGADEYGRAVFKDPYKAFDTMTELYAEGIALIRESNDLRPITRTNFSLYKTFGWQMTTGSEVAQEQARFVTKFLDIYENSFEKDPPLTHTEIPTTQPTILYPYTYGVLEVTYESSGRSFSMVAGMNTPSYAIQEGMLLSSTDEFTPEGEWMALGTMTAVTLTKENFDKLFGSGHWQSGATAADIRKDTASAWMVLYDQSHLYYVLQQKNGEVYLARVFYDYSEKNDPYSDDTCVRWLFKLGVEETADFTPTHSASTAEQELDPLEVAISTAILEHYGSDTPDGLLLVESHVLLADEVISSTPLLGQDNEIKKITVFLLVRQIRYSTYGGTLTEVGGSYVPAAITFRVSGTSEYTLEEYWEPRDGGYHVDDVRGKFPGASAEDALGGSQKYVDELEAQCYQKALAILNSVGGLDGRIEILLQTICSSPAESSNPGDYIASHEEEYQELTGYGEYTLRYCFGQFLQGGQTDLRGHIMESLCQTIMENWGEAVLMYDSDPPITGQHWFDAFLSNARSLKKQYNGEELEKYYPASWILLEMIGE